MELRMLLETSKGMKKIRSNLKSGLRLERLVVPGVESKF
jgi:hypothetical protein